jgi:hypothetical protein
LSSGIFPHRDISPVPYPLPFVRKFTYFFLQI